MVEARLVARDARVDREARARGRLVDEVGVREERPRLRALQGREILVPPLPLASDARGTSELSASVEDEIWESDEHRSVKRRP